MTYFDYRKLDLDTSILYKEWIEAAWELVDEGYYSFDEFNKTKNRLLIARENILCSAAKGVSFPENKSLAILGYKN